MMTDLHHLAFPAGLDAVARSFPHSLVFATVSGAHLYGFPSPDSDFDLRGCHVLPARDHLGLRAPTETEERLGPESGLELDLVSHEVGKFGRMLLQPNGYVLEQLVSPHVIRTSAAHRELLSLVPELVTKHHAHHYLGFAHNQWRMFVQRPRVKTLLYVYRVLLTGIHLMQSGEVEACLPNLLEHLPQPGVHELIAAKTAGAEKQTLTPAAVEPHQHRFQALVEQLSQAREDSELPERPRCRKAIDDLVVRLRLHA